MYVNADFTAVGDCHLATTTDKKVGIGTTSPQSHLHLAGAGDVVIRIQADTNDSGEGDNPMIKFVQDGNLLTGLIGTGNLPTGGGTNDNSYTEADLFLFMIKFVLSGTLR